jgi:hypothetical protein
MIILSDLAMVLLKPVLAGIILLALGIVSSTILGQYVTMEVQQTQRRDLVPYAKLFVESTKDESYTFPTNVQVFGTILVTEEPSNQSGDIRFIVLDGENYQKWSTGAQVDSVYSVNGQGQFNYTFTTAKGGTLHFVFDDRGLPYKKHVTLSVAYNQVLTHRVADTRLVPVGWVLMISGALVLVYGLARKAPIPWSGTG